MSEEFDVERELAALAKSAKNLGLDDESAKRYMLRRIQEAYSAEDRERLERELATNGATSLIEEERAKFNEE